MYVAELIVNDGSVASLPDTVEISTQNSAPVASAVSISGVAGIGYTLTGSYIYIDADDDPEGESTYRWMRDGVVIPESTGQSYQLTGEDLGSVIVFEVTPVAQSGVSPGLAVESIGVGPVVAETYGDITGDGKVDVADVLVVTRILLGEISVSPAEFQIIDVAPLVGGIPAPDGEINAGDLLIIQQMALGSFN